MDESEAHRLIDSAERLGVGNQLGYLALEQVRQFVKTQARIVKQPTKWRDAVVSDNSDIILINNRLPSGWRVLQD